MSNSDIKTKFRKRLTSDPFPIILVTNKAGIFFVFYDVYDRKQLVITRLYSSRYCVCVNNLYLPAQVIFFPNDFTAKGEK